MTTEPEPYEPPTCWCCGAPIEPTSEYDLNVCACVIEPALDPGDPSVGIPAEDSEACVTHDRLR